jgi:hypothetical protein
LYNNSRDIGLQLKTMGKSNKKKSKVKKTGNDAKITGTTMGPDVEEEEEEKNSRDFSNDLDIYLSKWETRHEAGANWKFNKILQAWATSNALNKTKVGSKLFKKLLPYIATIQGGARDRLIESTKTVILDSSSEILANECDDSDKALAVKRALKIQKLFVDA